MFVLTFSPSGEKVNTNMVLVHREVKMSTLGKIVNNHPLLNAGALLTTVVCTTDLIDIEAPG